MSPAELPFRFRQLIQKYAERSWAVGKFPDRQRLEPGANILNIPRLADLDLEERFFVFGKEFDYKSADLDWHKDIFTGERFPLSFSKSLNIRSTENISAKNVWEINRLQFLPTVALRYQQTANEEHLNNFIGLNTSWIDQNPYLLGVNWYSNIEVNIRLINWFLCWEILRANELMEKNDSFKEFAEKKWMPAIYQHCLYSYKNPSRYSSANNHLISEYAGLFVAASRWKFPESEKWLKYARKGLEKEIQLQHSSGVNREEAAEYIQFITDFFLLPYVIGKQTGCEFSEAYSSQLHQIFTYIHHFLDCRGNFPQYGDEDDGRCFVLDLDEDFNNFRSLLTSGAILFKDPLLKTKSNGFDLKNTILFGEEGRQDFAELPAMEVENRSVFFEDEGHFIFKKQQQDKEIYLHFDAAPLGYLSIAAHGHADALSFLLHVDGRPVLIDSGTYTYHTDPEWRKYFIGTLAHNTVRINGNDQAINGGPTLWVKHYKSEVLETEFSSTVERVMASHTGYEKEEVRHIRELTFLRKSDEFQILDTIIAPRDKKVQVEIPFHTHPDISVEKVGENTFSLARKEIRTTWLQVDKRLSAQVVKGQREPHILGWYSLSFLKKAPTSVIYNHVEIQGTITFEHRIKIR